MNKGLVIFTIILLIVTIFLLVGVLVVSINGGRVFEGFSIELGKDCEKVVDETFEIEDFDDVDINIDAANVEIIESEDNKVKVEIYAKNKEDYKVAIEDKKLVVEEIVRKYAGSITKKVLSESKGSTTSTVNTMMLGEKFKFLTDDGDIYECTTKLVGNIKDRKKNVNG